MSKRKEWCQGYYKFYYLNLINWCVTNHKNVIHILTYYVVEVAPITFIVTPVYKLFVVKLVETLIFCKRKTWIKYLILNGLYGLGQIRPLELSSFILPLWCSGWLSGWMIHFIRRNMWCSRDCLTITLWGLWYYLTKWCLSVINSLLMKCYGSVNHVLAGKFLLAVAVLSYANEW